MHYLSEVYVSFIFEGPVIFFTALGVGWRIFERTHGSTGTGGGGERIICRQKSIKWTIEN